MARFNAFILVIGLLAVFGVGMLAFEHAPRHAGPYPGCPAAALQPAICPNAGDAAGLSFHMNVFRTFAAVPWIGAALLAFAAFLFAASPRRAIACPARISFVNRSARDQGEQTATRVRGALRRWLARKENGPNRSF